MLLYRIKLKAVIAVAVIVLSGTANAHNVWCHCNFKDPKDTLAFFHLAGDVYTTHANAVRMWHDSNVPLENGVLAEFEAKLDSSKARKPELFRENLQKLQQLNGQLGELDTRLAKVIEFLKAKTASPGFNEALAKVLSSTKDIKRLSAIGSRYSEVGGKQETAAIKIESVYAIYVAQKEDLAMLRKKLDEVIAGARDAIPLAEKGEFAQVMLSGRNAFGDKMPQFTDWFSAYDRFYVQSCMATIAVTMQIYPKGFEWLKK
jgi:hypothetical protein